MPGIEDVGREFPQRLERIRQGLNALSGTYAGRIESAMKRNASWQDRTGNARNRLFAGAVMFGPNEFGITLGHGMRYGVYLEYGTRYMRGPSPADPTSHGIPSRRGSNWAYPILNPTAFVFWPRYVSDARRLVQRALRGRA